jgi:hypothetical protein
MLKLPQLANPHFLRALCRRAAQCHFLSSATSIRRFKVLAAHIILAYMYELPRPAKLTPLRAPFRQNGAKVRLLSPQDSANGWDGKMDGHSTVGAARGSASSGRVGALEPMLETMNFYHVGAAPASQAKVYMLALLPSRPACPMMSSTDGRPSSL